MDEGCTIVPGIDNRIGVCEIERALFSSRLVQQKYLPDGWVSNHYKWILWKLANYEIKASSYFQKR